MDAKSQLPLQNEFLVEAKLVVHSKKNLMANGESLSYVMRLNLYTQFCVRCPLTTSNPPSL